MLSTVTQKDMIIIYLCKICYCFWNSILQFVFDSSCTDQGHILFDLFVELNNLKNIYMI